MRVPKNDIAMRNMKTQKICKPTQYHLRTRKLRANVNWAAEVGESTNYIKYKESESLMSFKLSLEAIWTICF